MNNKDIKEEGIIFTPTDVVNKMLDSIGYYGIKIINKKVMENSFGEGAFLIEVVNRYVKVAKKLKISEEKIALQLEKNIYGIEKNKNLFLKTISFLNEEILKLGIKKSIKWNLFNKDTLSVWKKFENKFDYIFGNPPYVRIHNLKLEKEKLNNFDFYNGHMSDIYLFFIEISIKMLNKNGKISYIVPTSWLTANFSKKFREYLLNANTLEKILIFGNEYNPFKVSTYTSVINLNKNKKTKYVSLYKVNPNNKNFYFFKKFYLKNITWNNTFYPFINKEEKKIYFKNTINSRFNFRVKNGLATLNDDFFILKNKNYDLELKIPIIKASRNKQFYVIFPYDNNGELLSLDYIKNNDNKLFNLLIKNKKKLLNRDLENTDKWYGFGRSQGIKDINKEKIYLNNIFKSKKDIIMGYIGKNIAIYSGYYIIGFNKKEYNLIFKFLYSDELIRFSRIFGTHKANGFYSLNSKEIERYLKLKLNEQFRYWKNNRK